MVRCRRQGPGLQRLVTSPQLRRHRKQPPGVVATFNQADIRAEPHNHDSRLPMAKRIQPRTHLPLMTLRMALMPSPQKRSGSRLGLGMESLEHSVLTPRYALNRPRLRTEFVSTVLRPTVPTICSTLSGNSFRMPQTGLISNTSPCHWMTVSITSEMRTPCSMTRLALS